MQSNKRKQSPRSVSARVLIMGDRQVGKSATIVRFVTGRFIENYCHATNNWLYKHPLGFDERENIFNSVELLEQIDLSFDNCAPKNSGGQVNQTKNEPSLLTDGACAAKQNAARSQLAERVALDKKKDQNNYERQQLLAKLEWANAFVVIYSINDSSSFNKAIQYLNLIANNVNNSYSTFQDHHHQLQHISSRKFLFKLSSANNHQDPASNQSPSNSQQQQQSQLTQQLTASPSSSISSASSSVQSSSCSPISTSNSTCPKAQPVRRRRPVLLLGNKRDLDSDGRRQVAQSDARLLAIRHQTLFAEISIRSQSSKQIEQTLANLLAQIDPHDLHSTKLDSWQASSDEDEVAFLKHGQQRTQLACWSPNRWQLPGSSAQPKPTPIFSNIVRSVLTHQSIIGSSQSSLMGSQPAALARSSLASSTCGPVPKRQLCGPDQLSGAPSRAKLSSACSTVDEAADIQLATAEPVQSAPVASQSALPLKPRSCQPQSDRLGTLRSSFKRASLAIVSGRALSGMSGAVAAKRKSSRGSMNQLNVHGMSNTFGAKRNSASAACDCGLGESRADLTSANSVTSLDVNGLAFSSSESCGKSQTINKGAVNSESSNNKKPTARQTQTTKSAASWLMSHIKSATSGGGGSSNSNEPLSSNETAASVSSDLLTTGAKRKGSTGSEHKFVGNHGQLQSSSTRFYKRPLFKYKNRRETVALDQIPATSTSLVSQNSTEAHQSEPTATNEQLTERNSGFRLQEASVFIGSDGDNLQRSSSSARMQDGKHEICRASKPNCHRQQTLATKETAQVAFPSNPTLSSNSTLEVGAQQEQAPSEWPPTAHCRYKANRCSNGHLSSSLSTSDTYYTSSLFVVCGSSLDRPGVGAAAAAAERRSSPPTRTLSSAGSASLCSNSNSSSLSSTTNVTGRNYQMSPAKAGGRTTNRGHLHSNWASQASFSTGGSYEDTTSEDEVRAVAPSKRDSLGMLAGGAGAVDRQIHHHQAQLACGDDCEHLQKQAPKSKYQTVVKSVVQSTLSNLTKSSAVASAQVAKKSFCNALLKYSSPQSLPGVNTSNCSLLQTASFKPAAGAGQVGRASSRLVVLGQSFECGPPVQGR